MSNITSFSFSLVASLHQFGQDFSISTTAYLQAFDQSGRAGTYQLNRQVCVRTGMVLEPGLFPEIQLGQFMSGLEISNEKKYSTT